MLGGLVLSLVACRAPTSRAEVPAPQATRGTFCDAKTSDSDSVSLLQAGHAVAEAPEPSGDDPFAPYVGQSLVRIRVFGGSGWPSADRLPMLRGIGCRLLDDPAEPLAGRPDAAGKESLLAVCANAAPVAFRQRSLQEEGFAMEVLSKDGSAALMALYGVARPYVGDVAVRHRSRAGVLSHQFYSEFRPLSDISKRLASLAPSHAAGGNISLHTCLHVSHQSRPIHAIRLRGAGWKPGLPRVLVTAQAHAREWGAGMAAMYVAEMAAAQLRTDPAWLFNTEVVIVPIVNPDGFEYARRKDRMWRKNRAAGVGFGECRGVDLNQNWPTGWKTGNYSTDACAIGYVGPSPLSEPELLAVLEIVKEAPVSVLLDLHNLGNTILSPWCYTRKAFPRKAESLELSALMANAIRRSGGRLFTESKGNTRSVLGYTHGGDITDYISSIGGLGFVLELGQWLDVNSFNGPVYQREIRSMAADTWAAFSAALAWAQSHARRVAHVEA